MKTESAPEITVPKRRLTPLVPPPHSYIYWTDWGSAPKIERAGLDGSGRASLVSAPHVHWPNGITVDYANKKIYWCDGYLSKIMMSNMDGSGIEVSRG